MKLLFKYNIYLLSLGLFLVSNLYCQTSDSLFHQINKNRFSVSANFIYNYNSNKSLNSIIYPLGKIPNSTSGDSVYFMEYKYIDTKSFGLNISYSKRIAKNFSFSFGVGLNQKKEIKDYETYIDSNNYKPDLIKQRLVQYSSFVPIRLNYFFKRFIFIFGNNFGFFVYSNESAIFQDNSKKTDTYNSFYIGSTFQESISFQIVKNKSLYFTISAEQSDKFYKSDGYNNWFMFGAAYYF